MARVLIICPTFDHQDTLYPTIESVRRQTFQDFEVVVIGDGAPDRTADIMADIMKQDPRFRYEGHPKHERTGEPYRDPVIRASGCEIVAYISDDDLWLPWHLEWLVDALQTHDFAHSIDHTLHLDGHIQALLFQFASPALREQIAGRKTWCFGLSYAAHTRDAYLRLDEGWATSPAGIATDLNMWAKYAGNRNIRMRDILFPTALHLHSMLRVGISTQARAAEARKVLDSFGQAGFLQGIFERASFSEHFRYLFEPTTPRHLTGIHEVFDYHHIRYQAFGKGAQLPAKPEYGVLYCSEQAIQALDIQWQHYAGHATTAVTRTALAGLLATWPGNHDARRQLAELCFEDGDPAAAWAVLAPLKPGASAMKYTDLIPRTLLALDRFAEALDAIEILLAEAPDSPDLHLQKAQALAGTGYAAAAIRSASDALDLAPRFGWAHLLLGRWLGKQGKTGQGRQHLLQALEQGISRGLCYAELARLEVAAGDIVKAADSLETALMDGGRDEGLLQQISRQLHEQGASERADRLQALARGEGGL